MTPKKAALLQALAVAIVVALGYFMPHAPAAGPAPAPSAHLYGNGTGVGPAQDATGQAMLALYGLSTPTGGTGVGPLQDATMQALLAVIGGGSTPCTAHTVLGGVTYNVSPTDCIIIFDSSNGSLPQANLPTTGLFTNRTISASWYGWNGAMVPPQINAGGIDKVVAYSGMSASGAYVSSTTISTPGDTYTLSWGRNWIAGSS